MATDVTDPVATVAGLLSDNWDSGNCVKPLIRAMFDETYNKLHDYNSDGDAVLIYELEESEKPSSIGYGTVDSSYPVVIEFGTIKSRVRVMELQNEIRRIILLMRKAPGSNFNMLTYIKCNDQSSKYKKLWRKITDVRLDRFGEVV